MELLQDGLIAFFSAVGVTACVWLVAGVFLHERCRNPEIMLVLPVRGEASAMESDFRELLRLRRSIPKARIVIEDRGMQPSARELANYFCLRYDGVELRQTENDVE